ncbi:hypothetical protein O4H29_06740 [Marinobacter salarius]|uniref:hypothetical protein n=1 Tax=Marinobacter salarius TaxID=1420917 RepID=UPI0022B1967B|nr:hypothetical protein [Marinobacter salarius]MCZ4284529.1 hypothetical protein [Marinobacter salarius]
MDNKQPDFFFRSFNLSIDDLWTLASNPSAVFGIRPGGSKIYFVQVPSVSALHSFRDQG